MQLETQIPNALMRQLKQLEESIPDIEERMLSEGLKILEPEVKKNLQASIDKGYATGELLQSVDSKIETRKSGKTGVVYFKGTSKQQGYKTKNGVRLRRRKKAVRNGLKAAILEYGKQGQAPRPFVRTALNSKRAAIIAAMEKEFDDAQKAL